MRIGVSESIGKANDPFGALLRRLHHRRAAAVNALMAQPVTVLGMTLAEPFALWKRVPLKNRRFRRRSALAVRAIFG